MSRFKYSSDELDINKVLKMNKDVSKSLLGDSELKKTRNSADNNIDSSLELLRSLGKNKDILKLSTEIEASNKNRSLEHKPKLESWEKIVEQANLYEPDTVVLEDIMTETEIQSAFDELEKINNQFSRKTSIVNKTDLSFLAIATALQVAKTLIFPYVAEKFNYGKSFNPSERLDHADKSIKKAHKEANDKFRDKHMERHGTGQWINILYQSVPYDIVGKSMSGKNHRLHTLGHDPILGWIFGTANILTDCITFNDFHTNRISRIDPITGGRKMVITPETVFAGQMFKEC